MTSFDSNPRTIPRNSYLRIGNEPPENLEASRPERDPDLGIADNKNLVPPGLEFDLTNAAAP